MGNKRCPALAKIFSWMILLLIVAANPLLKLALWCSGGELPAPVAPPDDANWYAR